MENRQANNNGFGSGFFLGIIIGILATLLFTTKKGREVLHTLTDRSMDKITELETQLKTAKQEIVDELEEEDDYVEAEERIPVEPEPEPKPERKILARTEEEAPEVRPVHHTKHEEKGPVKKFFRIKKS
jgi:hypothetical protein